MKGTAIDIRIPAGLVRLDGELSLPPAALGFEEPGTLDAAAHLAADWFVEHLRSA